MKVLWFNVTEPIRYRQNNGFVGGWQDSLEVIASQCSEIELFVSFVSSISAQPTSQNRVTYIPIHPSYSFFDKISSIFSWKKEAKKIICEATKIINTVRPDVIHVFGTEWPFGLIKKYTNIPVVIHIQGSFIEISRYTHPSRYSLFDELYESKFNWRHLLGICSQYCRNKSRCTLEKKIWHINNFYMGRTNWDFQLSSKMHPNRAYFHVDEALREPFTKSSHHWQYKVSTKTILFSTGCSTFWKAPNLLLKTAKNLRERGFDFEWRVAGYMPTPLKNIVERKEHTTFDANNVVFLGWQTAEQIQQELLYSSLYIHNAYIENSPNSICEAQIIGTPVISTDVGGIPSLIENEETGFLVPINAPKIMAEKIISTVHNRELLCKISQNARKKAIQRHDKKTILNQLLYCYNTIISHK